MRTSGDNFMIMNVKAINKQCVTHAKLIKKILAQQTPPFPSSLSLSHPKITIFYEWFPLEFLVHHHFINIWRLHANVYSVCICNHFAVKSRRFITLPRNSNRNVHNCRMLVTRWWQCRMEMAQKSPENVMSTAQVDWWCICTSHPSFLPSFSHFRARNCTAEYN